MVETLPAVVTRMAALVECLCDELGDTVCYCGPFPGGDTPIDFCDCDDAGCGQAWVRLVRAFPSTAFPNPELDPRCAMPLTYEWEVGVARCAPMPDEAGNLPTREQNIDATVQQYTDMIAMRRAVLCCFGSDVDFVLGQYTPAPTLGGCLNSSWQVFSR